jgi:hypothetical protein
MITWESFMELREGPSAPCASATVQAISQASAILIHNLVIAPLPQLPVHKG